MTEVVSQVKAKRGYIAGLDGLRALAVLAVMLYHVFPTVFPGGYIGVDIFFVISGFLITTLLLKEHTKTGKIDFKNFWRRRARRLLPAIIVLIGVVSSIALFVHGDVLVGLGRQIIGALTFSNNWVEITVGANYFDNNNLQLFTHFWSLAVEEQFYAVWPFILTGLIALPLVQESKKKGGWICLGLAVVSAIWMAVAYGGHDPTRVYYGTDTHLFGLMIGAALAFWEYARTTGMPTRRLSEHMPFQVTLFGKVLPLQIMGVIGVVGLALLIVTMPEHSAFPYLGGLLLASLFAALLLMATIGQSGILQKIFALRFLEWIGVRSYGMYLWHWPIFVLLHTALPSASLMVAVLTFGLTAIIAALSYHYVEMPVRSGGLRRTIRRSIKRKAIIISNAETIWKVRPHPALVGSLAVLVLTGAAIATAPAETKAQAQIKAGQQAIREAAKQVHMEPLKQDSPPVVTSPKPQEDTSTPLPPAALQATPGTNITLVGDSVALASAPSLVERFPGILIDAEISRALRVGGFEDIAALDAAGNLRQIVVVALGTNGYYGNGKLDELLGQLAGHEVILVTAHGDREWIAPNNQDLRAAAARHPKVHIADWDAAIATRPDGLGPDGIHPNSVGGPIYTDCIAAALAQIR